MLVVCCLSLVFSDMSKHLIKFIGIGILIYILTYKINFKELISSLSTIKPTYLAALILLDVLFIFIKMFRWRFVLRCLNINYPTKDLAKIYYLSLILGTFTPAGSGDILTRSAFLVKDGQRLNAALVSIFIDRLADVFVLLLIALAGFLIFLPLFGLKSLAITLLIVFLLMCSFLIITIKVLRDFVKKIFLPFVPQTLKNKIIPHLIEAYDNITAFGFKRIVIMIGYTLLAQLDNLIFLFILAIALGISNMPPIYLLLTSALTSFIVLIPVSVGGLGTREATYIALFSLYGISAEKSVAFSLTIMLLPLASLACITMIYGLIKLVKKIKI